MRTFRCLALLASIAATGATLPAAESGSRPAWADRPDVALARASEAGVPVLVDLWAVWCVPCKAMDETTWADERVLAAFSAFAGLRVDADADPLFTERYDVAAFPTTLFLEPEGRELTRVSGYVEPDAMHALMQKVSRGYAAYREDRSHPDDAGAVARASSYLVSIGNPEEAVRGLRRGLKALGRHPGPAGERLELALAEAQLAAGRAAVAAAELSRLADAAAESDVRARALAALVEAWREKGDDARARQSAERLAREFPELAAAPGTADQPSK